MVQTFEWVGQHARLLAESSAGVEIPEFDASCKADWSFSESSLSGKLLFLFIYVSLFAQDSYLNSVELLSMRVLISLWNTYKGALQN